MECEIYLESNSNLGIVPPKLCLHCPRGKRGLYVLPGTTLVRGRLILMDISVMNLFSFNVSLRLCVPVFCNEGIKPTLSCIFFEKLSSVNGLVPHWKFRKLVRINSNIRK